MESEDLVTYFPFMFEDFQADESREALSKNIPLHQRTEEGISAHLEPDVLYLDLYKKRLKTELTLCGHKYFLKCHNGHQPPHSEMRGPHRHSYLFTFASLGSIGVYYLISALLGGV